MRIPSIVHVQPQTIAFVQWAAPRAPAARSLRRAQKRTPSTAGAVEAPDGQAARESGPGPAYLKR